MNYTVSSIANNTIRCLFCCSLMIATSLVGFASLSVSTAFAQMGQFDSNSYGNSPAAAPANQFRPAHSTGPLPGQLQAGFRPMAQDPIRNDERSQMTPPLRSALGNVHPINPAVTPSQGVEGRMPGLNTLKPLAQQTPNVADHSQEIVAMQAVDLQAKPRFLGDQKLRKSSGDLSDVHFMNPRTGVAVGSRGLIWRTIDGGSHWNPCHCPTEVDLSSVTFADQKQGWAVGGEALPVRGLHRGVVLTTVDGGMSWKKIQTTLLPRLVDVQTLPDGKLWATSIATAQFPQMVFESLDGGNSWNPLQFQWPKNRDKTEFQTAVASTTNTAVQPAWFNGTRCVFSHPNGVFSVAENQAIYSNFSNDEQQVPNSFLAVKEVSKRLIAISDDGRLFVSIDQGDNWRSANSMLPKEFQASAENFMAMAVSDDTVWIVQRNTGRILHGNVRTNKWQWETLPIQSPIQSIHFIDRVHGWAVGPLGNVLKTDDGGLNWTWEHSLHSNLAVLVVAEDSEDVPPALVTHLASNNHLNVGILLGHSSIPVHVLRDSLSEAKAAWTHVDPVPFETANPKRLTESIHGYLGGLRPQILLICPSQKLHEYGAIQATTWVNVAQKLRSDLPFDQQNPWGVMGQTVQLATTDCDSSTSVDGYAPTLEKVLGDAAHASELLQSQWRGISRIDGLAPKSVTHAQYANMIGIRRIASAGNQQLSWFSSVAKIDANGLDSRLSRFVGVSRPPALFNLAQQASFKKTFIQSFASATTNRPHLRSQWLQNLTTTLVNVPEENRVTWLVQLAEECERIGDHNKATLAYLEAWNWGSDKPVALYALTKAIPRLISDECQWKNRLEATEIAEQELAEMQQRIQNAVEQGLTTEEAQFDEALRRWGIDPAEKAQVPAHIIARIEALEKARVAEQSDGGLTDPETKSLIEIPNFQTFANQSVSPVKEFDDPAGNRVTRQSTVMSWSTVSDSASNVVQAGGTEPAAPTNLTIVDQLPAQRTLQTYRITKLADGLWPHLQSVPDWWMAKAYLAREMGDLSQVEATWNRFVQLQVHSDELTSNSKGSEAFRQWLETIPAFEKQMAARGEMVSDTQLFGSNANQSSERISAQFNWKSTWANQRPFLDGEINEPLWQFADSQAPLRVAVSNDEQFLYLAVVASDLEANTEISDHPTIQDQPLVNRQPARMVRDAANESDSILIHIDTDRDYQTDFVLCFDSKGRITERQGAGRDWNPTMYVAQDRPESNWNIEVAIDLADLSLPRVGRYWHMKVVRTGSQEQQAFGWTQIKNPMEMMPLN